MSSVREKIVNLLNEYEKNNNTFDDRSLSFKNIFLLLMTIVIQQTIFLLKVKSHIKECIKITDLRVYQKFYGKK